MRGPGNLSRRTLAALSASVLATDTRVLTGAGGFRERPSSTSDTPAATPVEAWGSHEAELLAQAEATHVPTVTLILAPHDGPPSGSGIDGEIQAGGDRATREHQTQTIRLCDFVTHTHRAR
ncbi:hypothetical protein O7614_21550 [Micromonospora sp. WMMD961]|uniref:hypothetical protein n=1 Tax=Micromonospora sp. WMMD961 TaxID=3016100 RepID=UPI0024168F6E|nr:hypothetical protein [Micromonospora sp. WMMD961]MDG4782250.1 hypothetical protein [Micromonospora sp. WMMD961]